LKLLIDNEYEDRKRKVPWHIQGDVIEVLHHASYQLEGHERHDFPILEELLEDDLVTADHVSGKAWVNTEFLYENR